jgi:hypothetical protein
MDSWSWDQGMVGSTLLSRTKRMEDEEELGCLQTQGADFIRLRAGGSRGNTKVRETAKKKACVGRCHT